MNKNLKVGSLEYRWVEGWSKIPNDKNSWAHHDIASLQDGRIVTGHSRDPKLYFLNSDGEVLNSMEIPVVETHGITPIIEDGKEYLYISDTGKKGLTTIDREKKIVKVDLNGKVCSEINRTHIPYLDEQRFVPTAVAQNELNGDIWVTDGYGSYKVLCFDRKHNFKFSLSGSEEAGEFNNPHWIMTRTKMGKTEVFVADRGNNQIQIFDGEGRFERVISQNGQILNSPSAMVFIDDILVVAELEARMVFLNSNDEIINTIDSGLPYVSERGWPNRLDEQGEQIAPTGLKPWCFNSPHGLCVDKIDNLYISEWLIGDRFIKLESMN